MSGRKEGYPRGNDDRSQAEWESSKAIEERSIAIVIQLLEQYFPVEIERTSAFSEEDNQGIDLILFPDRAFSDLLGGWPFINVQVKSSEDRLSAFFTKGKKKYGKTGAQWVREKLIVLDGSWVPASIIADFVMQLMNLMGIFGDSVKENEFLSYLDPFVQNCYRGSRIVVQGYREQILSWVQGKEAPSHSSSPASRRSFQPNNHR